MEIVKTYIAEDFTYEYAGRTSSADKNNLPNNQTIKEPPAVNNLQVAVMTDTKDWVIEDDYRKQEYYYIKTKKRVNFVIGQLPDNSMTNLVPNKNDVWDESHGVWKAVKQVQLAENEYTYYELLALKEKKYLKDELLKFKNFSNQEDDIDDYKIWFMDDGQEYYCRINSEDNPNEVLDFNTKYKEKANSKTGVDKNTGILEIRPRTVDGKLFQNYIYVKTGIDEIDSGPCPYWSIDTSISGKTIIDFAPNYSYQLEGGRIHAELDSFINDFKVAFTLAPDIPVEYGGNHSFISNKKLKNAYMRNELEIIAPPAYIKYYEDNLYANVLRITLIHDASDNAELEISLRLYK